MHKRIARFFAPGLVLGSLLIGTVWAAPSISLTTPERVSSRSLTISGTASSAASLRINGQVVNLSGDRFTQVLSLNEGSNTITLIATDSANKSTTVTKTVIVDTTAPTINLTLPEYTRLKTLTVSAELNEDATVKINNVAATKAGQRYTASIPLREGENTVTVEATDTAGNAQAVTKKIVLDTVQPSLTVLAPRITNTKPVIISGKTEPGVTITINGRTIANTNGTYVAQQTIVEGRNNIAIVSTDRAGNSTTTNKTVILDTTEPEISFAVPALTRDPVVEVIGNAEKDAFIIVNGTALPNNNGSFRGKVPLEEGVNTITAVAIDAVGNARSVVKNVTLDQTGPTLTVDAPELTNQKSVSISAATEPGATLAVSGKKVSGPNGIYTTDVALVEGENTILVAASDEAGNTTTVSKVIVLDTKAPALELLAPTLTNETTISVTGTVEDGCTVVVGGQLVTVTNGTFNAAVRLDPGANAVTATATDSAGNSTSVTKPVTLDADKPQITFSVPELVNTAFLTAAGQVNKDAVVTVNGERVTVNGGSFTVKLNLKEGPNTVTVTATDSANNVVTVTKTVTLDTRVPSLNVIVPEISSTESITINGQTESSVSLLLNNEPVSVSDSGQFSTVYKLKEGLNQLSFVVTDKAQNRMTLNKTVVYRPYTSTVQLYVGYLYADIDGNKQVIPVAPLAQNDAAYLPLRTVRDLFGVALGFDANWRPNSISQGQTTVDFTVNELTCSVNGVQQTLAAPAIINEQNLGFIPAAMLEWLGYAVEYDAPTATITIRKLLP